MSNIDIVLASDQRGAEGVLVAAYSAMKTASRPVRLWIIEDGITPETKRRMTKAWSAAEQCSSVQFRSIRSLPLKIPSSWDFGRLPKSACARLQLVSVVPQDVKRCVYLDYDTLTGIDLGELVDIDMKGYPVAMVPAYELGDGARDFVRSLGMDPDQYGNSGVLLVDVEQWRDEDVAAKLIAHGTAMPPNLWFFDQDMINSYFRGRCLWLERRWNMLDAAAKPDENVIHFAGVEKPWRVDPNDALVGHRAWLRARAELDFEPEPETRMDNLRRRMGAWRAKIQRRLITLGRRFA